MWNDKSDIREVGRFAFFSSRRKSYINLPLGEYSLTFRPNNRAIFIYLVKCYWINNHPVHSMTTIYGATDSIHSIHLPTKLHESHKGEQPNSILVAIICTNCSIPKLPNWPGNQTDCFKTIVIWSNDLLFTIEQCWIEFHGEFHNFINPMFEFHWEQGKPKRFDLPQNSVFAFASVFIPQNDYLRACGWGVNRHVCMRARTVIRDNWSKYRAFVWRIDSQWSVCRCGLLSVRLAIFSFGLFVNENFTRWLLKRVKEKANVGGRMKRQGICSIFEIYLI